MRLHHFFKPLVTAAVGAALTMSATMGFAQMAPQTADMTVTGTIVPAACSASFAGGGEVDFGTLRLIDLSPTAYTDLGRQSTGLQVDCSADKRVRFSVTDLQTASLIADTAMVTLLNGAGADYMFGLGTGAVGGAPVNLGSYVIEFGTPKINGVDRGLMYSDNGGSSWLATSRLVMRNTRLYTAGTTTTPAAGKQFSFPLTIRAGLNRGSALQVTEDTKLNGQAVFAISYQ